MRADHPPRQVPQDTALTLLRIVAISIVAHFAFVSARMTGSLYALSNQASTFTVGLMVALSALIPMLIAVHAGRWLDAVGARRPAWLGSLMIFGGVLLPAAVPYEVLGVVPLLIGMMLIGTGATLAMLTVQHVIGDRTDPPNRTAAFSWLGLGASISGFCGPIISGLLIDRVGHRGTLGYLVIATLVLALLVWLSRDLLPARRAAPRAGVALRTHELLRHRPLRQVLIVSAMVSMSWDLLVFMVPVHGNRVGLPATQVGLILSSFAVATFVIRLAIPWLAGRIREWAILTFTLFTAMVAFLLFPLFTTTRPLMMVAFLLGLGLGAALPNTMSLLHTAAPEGRVGEALGVRTMIMNGSHVALPLALGVFGVAAGVTVMFWTVAFIVGVGGVAAARWQRESR